MTGPTYDSMALKGNTNFKKIITLNVTLIGIH